VAGNGYRGHGPLLQTIFVESLNSCHFKMMVGATPETEDILRAFLSGFINLAIEEQVCNLAVTLRKKHKIKLPEPSYGQRL
jgi:CxxC motif-containing protein (DUF1111 family)